MFYNISKSCKITIALIAIMLSFQLAPLNAYAESKTSGDDIAATFKLARAGDSDAMYRVALYLLDEKKGQQKNAFGWALNAARSGHGKAAELTGRLYRLGHGVDVNYAKSRKWLLRARGLNEAGANFELALLFADPENPSYDKAQAAIYIADALKRSEPRACLIAAQAKIMADYPTRKILRELNCAAEGGFTIAMLYIADYYRSKRSPHAEYFAQQWLEKAATAGDNAAQTLLAENPF